MKLSAASPYLTPDDEQRPGLGLTEKADPVQTVCEAERCGKGQTGSR